MMCLRKSCKQICDVNQLHVLKVNYQERFSAAGRIPRTGLRKEMGATPREMAASQMVESALEPLFEPGFASRCQVSSAESHVDTGA